MSSSNDNPFICPAEPEERPDIKKIFVRNKFLVVIQLLMILFLELVPQFFVENFLKNNIKNHSHFSLMQTVITFVVTIFIIFLGILWGRKIAKVKWDFLALKQKKNLIMIGFGFIGVFISAIIGSIFSVFLNGGVAVIAKNQQGADIMTNNMPLLLFWFMAAISGPVIEETVFRVGFFEFLFREHAIFAWFVGAVFFGLVHTYDDLTHFPTYFMMGIAFGWIYWKTRRIEVSASVHFFWNTMATLITML